jgi:hypothetical protein
MKKTASLVLMTVLCAAAGASSATVDVTCNVKHGKCKAEVPAPPAPPAPPAAPAPPAPPVPPSPPPDADNGSFRIPPMPPIPRIPAIPAMPSVPAPPPPPKLPDVPAAAHATCAGKAEGTEVTYTIREGEWMRGVCERDGKQMAFMMRRYHAD